MRRILLALLIIAMVPVIASCAAPREAAKGTGEGTMEIIEGTGKGLMGLGEGTGTAIVEGGSATGEFVTGRGEEAAESGKAAATATGEGITDIVVEPLEGLGKGLQTIDKGIKKATGREDVK